MTPLFAKDGLGFLSGALSTLSPCVLPLLPIVLGSAISKHRFGAIALGAGVVISFTLIGFFLAAVGSMTGITANIIRPIAATILILMSLLVLVPSLGAHALQWASPFSEKMHGLLREITDDGLVGQLLIGLVLGVLWAPCAGPTLGAAVTIASEHQDIPEAISVMLSFALGATAPLVLLGTFSQGPLHSLMNGVSALSRIIRVVFALVLGIVGVSMLTHINHPVETWLFSHYPDWLTNTLSRF